MILNFVGKHLKFMGILYPSNDAVHYAKIFHYIQCGFVYISLGIFTIPTFCYCVFEADSFYELVNSFFFSWCGTLGISFQSVLLYGKSKVNQLFVDITEKFNQRRAKCPELQAIYDKAELSMEFQTKIIYMLMLRMSVPIIVTQFILWSFFQYFRSDFSKDSFILIYPWAIPFDWKSPIGYSIVTIFQIIGIVSCSEVCVVVLCFYTGICLAITAFITDIEFCLNDFNLNATIDTGKSLQQIRLMKSFNKILQFHSEIKDYTKTFARRLRGIIICYFAYATVSISSLLLCITGAKSLEFIQPAACLNVVVFWLLIYCYFGDQVTGQLVSIADNLYNCNWHLFPLQVRKSLPMMLLAADSPIYILGFGTTSCTRDTFKTIANAGFSYFTMLRQVSN